MHQMQIRQSWCCMLRKLLRRQKVQKFRQYLQSLQLFLTRYPVLPMLLPAHPLHQTEFLLPQPTDPKGHPDLWKFLDSPEPDLRPVQEAGLPRQL